MNNSEIIIRQGNLLLEIDKLTELEIDYMRKMEYLLKTQKEEMK